MIRKSGITNFWTIGLLSAIPYVFGAVAMYLLGRHSDRKLERRWHFMGSAVMAALGVALLPAASSQPTALIVLLCIATAGYLGMLSLFWTIPPRFLSGLAAAGGLAFINSIGTMGGFVGPTIVGFLRDYTGSFSTGTIALGGFLIAASLLAWSLKRFEAE